MNIQKPRLATGLAIFSLILPVKTLAASFTQIFAFGDSLVDTGNVFQISSGAIPPMSLGYSEGRFSNGLNWLDYLAQDLKLEPIATLVEATSDINLAVNGINFAFGGATTGGDNTFDLTLPKLAGLSGLQQQIETFVNFFTPIANTDALYIIGVGANDYFPTNSTFTPLNESDTSTTNIINAVNTLVNYGAKNLMVVNLPDLAQLPLTNILSESEKQRLTELTNSHNQQLKILSDNLPNDIKLIEFDINSPFAEIIANPQRFGLSNVTEGCLLVGCYNPMNNVDLSNQFLFWDNSHPTTATHRMIANAALSTLKTVPESSSPLVFLVLTMVGKVTIVYRRDNS